MNNQDKGYLYEIQIRDYIINELKNPAYLWNDTPETILLQHNIIGSHNINRLRRIENKINPLQDTGIDIIQIENDNCSLVQCKNGYKKGLRMEDLAGFNAWMNALDTLKGYVYYTDKLSINILSLPPNKRIEYVKKSFEQHNSQEINVLEEYKPYVYQQIAVSKFTEYFRDNNRGILSMPCGTGKTMTSYLISKKFKQIILLSPLKEFAKQNLNRYIEYGYENKTLLVSSDGCRDVGEIKKFIKSNKSFIISSTFCSVDCIRQIIDKCDDDLLIIIDEFHNLSKNNVIDETDDFYKILNSKKKIMYMSATPRVYELEDELEDTEHIFGEIFYKMSFNEAIEKKFITDYKIWLPSIHEDNSQLEKELSIYDIDGVMKGKCNFFFSCLLNNGSKKCIIYCQDTNEIKLMTEAMSKLNEFYCLDIGMNQITADNTEKQRKKILDDFRERDNIKLLFSVRILDECIDIPSCDSIFITYPTKSKIRTIQRMSRCMRINKSNPFKVGNIFIWCDEYDKILETLSGIKEYDIMFKDKIKVNSIGFFVKGEKKKNETDVGLVEKYIMGVKEFRIVGWEERLEMVKKYIDENGKRPIKRSDDKNTKIMGFWISHQNRNYKTKKYNMKNQDTYNKYTVFINDEKYKKYFISNEELWHNNFASVKKYINDTNKLPSINEINENIKTMSHWISNQHTNYKLKCCVMKNKEIYDKWTNFITSEKYKIYFISNEEIWNNNFDSVRKYIDEYKKRPSEEDKQKEVNFLGKWITHQIRNYKLKERIMKNQEIYDKWTEFIKSDKYKIYFMSNNDEWYNKLEEVKNYIDKNNNKPSDKDTNKNIRILGKWLSHQQTNYKKKDFIMKNQEIYEKWKEFITSERYKIYFISNEEVWNNNLDDIKKYIDENNRRPSSKNNKIMDSWISHQQLNYKVKDGIMKNQEIYDKWTNFITSEKYNIYFMSNEELWHNYLEDVKKYIDKNNKRPSNKNGEKLGNWLSNQFTNYNTIEQIMKNKDIYDKFTNFINSEKYKKYFMSNEEIWNNHFDEIKMYIDKNNKTPSQHDSNDTIKIMGAWLSNQHTNYKLKYGMMKNEEIYNKWTNFITSEKYKIYFISNEEIWNNNFDSVRKYIDEYKKRPSEDDKIMNIKIIGRWVSNQMTNYKFKDCIMKNQEIYDKWTKFITSEKYKIYFISHEEEWKISFNKVKKYIDEYNKRPSAGDSNSDIKMLGRWITVQQKNKNSKECIMKNKEIYDIWDNFITSEKYKKYFISNKEVWSINLSKVKKYINENNKRPSQHNTNIEIKFLSSWISNQLKNYKKIENIMTDPEIYNQWTEFITDSSYLPYF